MKLASTGIYLNTTNSNLFFLSCPWTIETPTERLEVTITRKNFTLLQQFRLRLQIHPAGDPLFSRFITLTRFHEHFASANDAIRHYRHFPKLGFPELDLTVINSLLTDPVVKRYT